MRNGPRLRKAAFKHLMEKNHSESIVLKRVCLSSGVLLMGIFMPILVMISALRFVNDSEGLEVRNTVGLITSVTVFMPWSMYVVYLCRKMCLRGTHFWSMKGFMLQDFFGEISVTLLTVTNAWNVFDGNSYSIAYTTVTLLAIVMLWFCRFFMLGEMRQQIPFLYGKVVFAIAGHCIHILCLNVLFYKIASSEFLEVIHVAALGLLMTVLSLLNVLAFYVGYMYEITVQSALLLYRSGQTSGHANDAVELLNKLGDLPVFHKNMFPLAFNKYSIGVFLWPVTAAIPLYILHVQVYSGETLDIIFVVTYISLQLLFNYRVWVMSIFFYKICILIVVFAASVLFIILVYTALYYTTCSAPIAFIMCVIVIKK